MHRLISPHGTKSREAACQEVRVQGRRSEIEPKEGFQEGHRELQDIHLQGVTIVALFTTVIWDVDTPAPSDAMPLAMLGARDCSAAHPPLTERFLPPQVLKQVHPDTGISSKAMSILNSFIGVTHCRRSSLDHTQIADLLACFGATYTAGSLSFWLAKHHTSCS